MVPAAPVSEDPSGQGSSLSPPRTTAQFVSALNGNVLLDRLHGATVSLRPGGTDMNAEMTRLAETLRAEGETPYVIPGGGSNTVGALGYVDCALELMNQANSRK